jgi:hypothetical protein
MEYLTVKETGIKWGLSKRRVLVLCSQNRIPGTIKMAPLWLIPSTAEKPADGRKLKKRDAKWNPFD